MTAASIYVPPMRALWLQCSCGHAAKIRWPMDRTTLRADILPRTKCSVCGQRAADMRVIWEPEGDALEGARTRQDG